MAKKHYIDVLIDKVRDAAEDGLLNERRVRLRDDAVGLIEREKDEALASLKKENGELRRELGELRVENRDLRQGVG